MKKVIGFVIGMFMASMAVAFPVSAAHVSVSHSFSAPHVSSTPHFSPPPMVQPRIQAAPIRSITPIVSRPVIEPPAPVVLPQYSRPVKAPVLTHTTVTPQSNMLTNYWFWVVVVNHGKEERIKVSCLDPKYKDYKECIDIRNKKEVK